METYRYLPYGERYAGTHTPHQYTGKERDAESGLDYFGARYLASAHGRWMSVDPELGRVAKPQALNRYTYVTADPVGRLDPDGRQDVRVDCIRLPSVETVMEPPRWVCYGSWVDDIPESPKTDRGGGGPDRGEQRFNSCKTSALLMSNPLDFFLSSHSGAEYNVNYEMYQLASSVAGRAGVGVVDVLSLWGTESSFSTDPDFPNGGPMQMTTIAYEELRRRGYTPSIDVPDQLVPNQLFAALLDGANYWRVVLDHYMSGIPEDQAYAVYNMGRGGWNSPEAQRNQSHFNRIHNVMDMIDKCLRSGLLGAP